MRLHRKSILACISYLQLPIRRVDCFAFKGGNLALLEGKKRLVSIYIDKEIRPSTSRLFGRQDDEGGDDEKRPINDLDIFGEPKDAKQSKGNPWEEEGDIRGPDRIKSCIPYILPLIDGDTFGKYIYERIPPLGDIHYVALRPIVEGFEAAPALIIVLFVLFSLGPRFTNQSREVRFNAQQAILIDVALIFPSLLGSAVAEADANLPRSILEPSSNFVWYFYVSLVIYCVTSNLRGKKPDQIPFISNIAEYAIGPF